jgi:hypothetical protein
MSYQIPEIPSKKAYIEEFADFWEVNALGNPQMPVSQRDIARQIGYSFDELNHDGIESEDDGLEARFDEIQKEHVFREQAIGNKYPFEIKKYALKLKEESSIYKDLYLFLLLATRLNMTAEKNQNGIDGALLFEEICASAIGNYFGDKTESFVFGTAVSGSFKDKIADLIRKIGEGGSYSNPDPVPLTKKKDGGVDIVAYKNFADGRSGKLIAFGQCKTGTSTWRKDKNGLQPQDFCTNWFSEYPVYTPLSLLFICDTMNIAYNFISDQRRYIVFNRFRIMEYLTESLDESIIERVQWWVTGALKKVRNVS